MSTNYCECKPLCLECRTWILHPQTSRVEMAPPYRKMEGWLPPHINGPGEFGDGVFIF